MARHRLVRYNSLMDIYLTNYYTLTYLLLTPKPAGSGVTANWSLMGPGPLLTRELAARRGKKGPGTKWG